MTEGNFKRKRLSKRRFNVFYSFRSQYILVILKFQNFLSVMVEKRLIFITRLYNLLIRCSLLAENLDTKSNLLHFKVYESETSAKMVVCQ